VASCSRNERSAVAARPHIDDGQACRESADQTNTASGRGRGESPKPCPHEGDNINATPGLHATENWVLRLHVSSIKKSDRTRGTVRRAVQFGWRETRKPDYCILFDGQTIIGGWPNGPNQRRSDVLPQGIDSCRASRSLGLRTVPVTPAGAARRSQRARGGMRVGSAEYPHPQRRIEAQRTNNDGSSCARLARSAGLHPKYSRPGGKVEGAAGGRRRNNIKTEF